MEKVLTQKMFLTFRDFIHENYGIYYADVKKDLLNLKLNRCLIKSGVETYNDYFNLVSSVKDSIYINHFLSEITVNKTNFFRENDHFEFIKNKLEYIYSKNPNIKINKEIKVWSMACSTGQEAYTTAMVLNEIMPDNIKIKILATDISSRVLKAASEGIYSGDIETEVNPFYLNKYFVKSNDQYMVKNDIKRLITFRHFNLMNPFPFSGQFDIVFCRNLMIYFDLETQKELLQKIYDCLAQGGILIIGKSESILSKYHSFKHIVSSIYIK